ncbi:MAG: UMP kinase [Bacteroidales bacterium]|nr:UMP kinase [Bacteroidales bacterium]MDD2424441.1 UMP kinase [Bacteroidales bacterium]MDD3989814.1 UMP kinase [Bacteroidales bacterium]MDD4639216.1 UMP kinase [Bacteroidales bacterium]
MKYKRVLLKLSGESIGGSDGYGIDQERLSYYAHEIHNAVSVGVQVAVVVGGGNIFRGLEGTGKGFDRVKGDQMGMLATIINSIGLSVFLKKMGVDAEVFSSTPAEPYARYYNRDAAVEILNRGGVSIIAGGTGNPFFTTDSASALRAAETGAGALLKGTRVDGVYSADPEKDPKAVKYPRLSFEKVLDDNLRIMDQTAFTICRENRIPIVVFDVNKKGNLLRVLNGEEIGSVVCD